MRLPLELKFKMTSKDVLFL